MALRRPKLTTAETRQEVPRSVLETVDEVNSLRTRMSAAEDAISTVSTELERLSVDGSIFSMVGPGSPRPVVAYDFTRFDSALTAAQNAALANRSGIPAYDLGLSGTPTYGRSAAVAGAAYAFQPYAASVDGGCVQTDESHYLVTSGAPGGLQLKGALTVEWLGHLLSIPDADCIIFSMGGPAEAASEVLADNVLYSVLYRQSTGAWRYLAEQGGAGANTTVALVTSGDPVLVNAGPLLVTLTRNADGDVLFYLNGRLAGGSTSVVSPTGGTATNLNVGAAAGASPAATTRQLVTYGVRIFNVELSPAEVQESYRRTFFGVGG